MKKITLIGTIAAAAVACCMLGGAVATIFNPEDFTPLAYWWFIFLFFSSGIYYGICAVWLWRKLRQPW